MKIALTATTMLAAALAGCHGQGSMQGKSPTVKEVLGFSLPSYVVRSEFSVERGMDLLAYLKVEVPQEKLNSFLEISPLFPTPDPARSEPIRFASYNTTQKWWTPGELATPSYGSKEGRRDKWTTSSYLAVSCSAVTCLLYFIYMEEA
ncbi:MAG: hypothetical protein R3B48_15120 [Kofleriaceae bacterium]